MVEEKKKLMKLIYCPQCKKKLEKIEANTYGYQNYFMICYNVRCKFCGILRYLGQNG